MLYTLAAILMVVWLLGWVSDFMIGGFIHLLLPVAAIMIVVEMVRDRKKLKS